MKNLYTIKIIFTLIAFIGSTAHARNNPDVINGVARYHKNATIGAGKDIPDGWKEIIIEAGVTLTGRFDFAHNSDLVIRGLNRTTSRIKGLPRNQDAFGGAGKAGIFKRASSGKLRVAKLTILDQPGRGIIAWGGDLNVKGVTVKQVPLDYESDGVHATNGWIKGSGINVYDDATYITMTKLIHNTYITHRRNGAPFQISWGQHTGNNEVKTISKCKVKPVSNQYNMGVLAWTESKVNNDSIRVHFKDGFTRLAPSSGSSNPAMYSFGNWDGGRVVKNGTIKVRGHSANDTLIVQPNSTGKVQSY